MAESNSDITFTALSVTDINRLVGKARILGLDDNGMFSRYTPEQMAEVYNGIGPDRFPEWFRDFLTSLNHVILPAVLIHDLDYDHGGTKADFYASNKRLGRNARKCIRSRYSRLSVKYWIYLAKIRLFVIICNERGQVGWNFTGTENAQH